MYFEVLLPAVEEVKEVEVKEMETEEVEEYLQKALRPPKQRSYTGAEESSLPRSTAAYASTWVTRGEPVGGG